MVDRHHTAFLLTDKTLFIWQDEIHLLDITGKSTTDF